MAQQQTENIFTSFLATDEEFERRLNSVEYLIRTTAMELASHPVISDKENDRFRRLQRQKRIYASERKQQLEKFVKTIQTQWKPKDEVKDEVKDEKDDKKLPNYVPNSVKYVNGNYINYDDSASEETVYTRQKLMNAFDLFCRVHSSSDEYTLTDELVAMWKNEPADYIGGWVDGSDESL